MAVVTVITVSVVTVSVTVGQDSGEKKVSGDSEDRDDRQWCACFILFGFHGIRDLSTGELLSSDPLQQ